MARTRASAKKAGAFFERQIADHLAVTVDDRIDRQVKTGGLDRGDVSGLRFHGHRVAIECKNEAQMRVSGWLAEVEAERKNLGALAGVVVSKRHGKGAPGVQLVTMTLDDFVALMTLSRRHVEGDTYDEKRG